MVSAPLPHTLEKQAFFEYNVSTANGCVPGIVCASVKGTAAVGRVVEMVKKHLCKVKKKVK